MDYSKMNEKQIKVWEEIVGITNSLFPDKKDDVIKQISDFLEEKYSEENLPEEAKKVLFEIQNRYPEIGE